MPHPRHFPGKLFQNIHKRYISWSLFLLKLEILDCRPVTLEKKGQLCKSYFGIFEIFEHPFLSDHFQKSICSGVFNLKLCIFLKMKFHYIFSKVFTMAISKQPHANISRVKGCRLWSCVSIEKLRHQRQFSKIRFSP